MNKQDYIIQINEKFKLLEDYLKILKSLGKIDAGILEKDVIKRGAVERYLQLACEIILDVANQIIAEHRFRTPDEYKSSILILGEEGVLDKKFSEDFSKMAGFRNILVHDYLKLDYEKVADKVNNRLGDFEKFAKAVAKFIGKD